MEGVGYTPTLITQLMTNGADAVASSKQGRCPITAVAVAKGPRWDPWVMGPTSTIMEMVGILLRWEGDG
eukprot:12423271-Karenia_brevis.AAC.1